jgi:predicted SprT family Zn-dependent metalloprotease
MFNKKLEALFIGMIIIAVLILANNWYSTNNFKNNPISDEYQKLITQKEQEILENMQEHYGFKFQVPLIVTDKFKNRLYGAAVNKDGKIKIYLNKNVMQESMDYMVDSVIAHEYAHVFMFKKRFNSSKDSGHSAEWKQTCINIGGLNCEQYVDRDEVVMGKMPF